MTEHITVYRESSEPLNCDASLYCAEVKRLTPPPPMLLMTYIAVHGTKAASTPKDSLECTLTGQNTDRVRPGPTEGRVAPEMLDHHRFSSPPPLRITREQRFTDIQHICYISANTFRMM